MEMVVGAVGKFEGRYIDEMGWSISQIYKEKEKSLLRMHIIQVFSERTQHGTLHRTLH